MSRDPAFRRTFPAVTDAELATIDKIRAAYLACNAVGGPLEYETTPGNTYGGEPTAMGYLAEAGRTAWRQVGVTGVDLWDVMGDSGEGARYVFDLYTSGYFEV